MVANKRQPYPVDLGLVMGRNVGPAFVQVPSAYDEFMARVWAAKFVSDHLGADVELDEKASTNLETVYIIAQAFRDPKDPDVPAFGPPEWLLPQLSAEDVELLLGEIEAARAKDSKRQPLTAEYTASVAYALGGLDPDVDPESASFELLQNLTRADLVDLVTQLSQVISSMASPDLPEDEVEEDVLLV